MNGQLLRMPVMFMLCDVTESGLMDGELYSGNSILQNAVLSVFRSE